MRFLALATDYDGTLAHDGRVTDATWSAIERCRASGRKVILVTGRELADLERTCSHLERFDTVVAENGALLYDPRTREEHPLAAPPPELFVLRLRERGVTPISIGRSIVATWEPHGEVVREVIRELGLDLQVIGNKGAVMVLPAGVNKAFGLTAALEALQLSPSAVVGVGDAENDGSLLAMCGFAVAVANALPALKERADFTTKADHGEGVSELIDELIATDLAPRQRGVQDEEPAARPGFVSSQSSQ